MLHNEVNAVKVSIIVPCYNAETKIGRCFSSLEKVGLEFELAEFEVIFVDDCSTDRTVDRIRHQQVDHPNWSIVALKANTGSPSRPRNVGVTAATGEYVFFLDSDDEIHAAALSSQYRLAVSESADLVRTSVELAELGKPNMVVNRIDNYPVDDSVTAQIAQIIRQQSTTNSSLIRRSLLTENAIEWPDDLHMGEDTIFLLNVLTRSRKVCYLDEPGIVYHKTVSLVRSATQQYTARDLASHLNVWDTAEQILSMVGLSYLRLRGSVGVRAAIDQMYRFGVSGLPDSSLIDFSAFVQRHAEIIRGLSVRRRIRQTLEALEHGDVNQIRENLRQRLLIAGSDLKFIKAAVPALEKIYEIRIDEWAGHDSHDSARSTDLLGWADVILCEWLLGNAVWYAERKAPHQRLVVRLHRFELTRDFGLRINQSAVDCFFSVSAHTAEDMISTFGVDRTKVRVIPNFIVEDKYAQGAGEDRLFRLGLVGPVPRMKGLYRALELLYSLRLQDERYSLTIYGKRPEELPWVIKDEDERRYYAACDRFILDHGLSEAVSYAGWVDTSVELAHVGFVLSLSDFESFHVAPAEAFAAGNQALFLPWRGVEFLYPKKYIHDDLYSMRDYILANRVEEEFQKSRDIGQRHVLRNYSLASFTDNLSDMIASI